MQKTILLQPEIRAGDPVAMRSAHANIYELDLMVPVSFLSLFT